MLFQKRLEKAMKAQKELSGLTDEAGEKRKSEPQPAVSAGEAFKITLFALLYFVPLCLGILLLMCFLGSLFLFL